MLRNRPGLSAANVAQVHVDRHGSEDAGSPPTSILSVHTLKLHNVEDLREATRGADLKVVQLAPGSFEGQLTHARIGGLSISAGDFYPDIRARGVMNQELVTIGMMVESSGEVKQWDYDVVPGDIVVFPKAVEQEGRFTGKSRYVTLTLDEEELAQYCAGELDPRFWTRIHRLRTTPATRARIRRDVADKVAQLRQGLVPNSGAATDYFGRSLLEAFIFGILDAQGQSSDRHRQLSSRLVKAVEDHVDSTSPHHLVHVSELCLALRVSRRTLHRAFHETLGCGPLEYLRLRRLAAVRSRLTNDQSVPPSVTQAALDAGFLDLGRFGKYYRRLYGETPTATRRRAERLKGREQHPD